VTAATQCHCMVFTRQILIPILAKYPDARMKLLERARQRLIALNAAIDVDPTKEEYTKDHRPHRVEGCAIGFGSVIQNQDAHLFAANPIFQNARVDLLYELSSQMTTKHYDQGRTIIQQGQLYRADSDYVYWIVKGQVEVWQDSHFVAVLNEGEVFGELAAFDGGERRATVKSRTKVTLRMVRGNVLQQILNWHEDKLFLDKWKEEMQKRKEQLAHKEQLRKQMWQKPVHLDFMFLKLTDLSQTGTRRKKRDVAMEPSLYGICGLEGNDMPELTR